MEDYKDREGGRMSLEDDLMRDDLPDGKPDPYYLLGLIQGTLGSRKTRQEKLDDINEYVAVFNKMRRKYMTEEE